MASSGRAAWTHDPKRTTTSGTRIHARLSDMKFSFFNQATIGFASYFLRAYPARALLLILLLVLSGLSEAVGIAMLLPLLELAAPAQGARSGLSSVVSNMLASIGLSPRLGVLLSLVVAGMLMKGIFRLLAMKQAGYTVAHVASDMRLALIRALMRTHWSYFVSQPAGRLASAIGYEASRAASSYQHICALLASTIQVLVYAAVAFLVSWKVALLGIGAGAIVIGVLTPLIRISREAGYQQTQLLQSLLSRLMDALQGIKPIKAMAREQHLQPLLERETREINRAQARQVLAAEAMFSAQEPILVVLMAAALYIVLTIGQESMAAIMVMAFLFYRLAGRVSVLQSDYQAISAGEGSFWSMRQAIDTAEQQQERADGSRRSPTLQHGITLRSVSFSYGDRPVLIDVSMVLPAGRFVALIGPSGAGKTTIADLIVGLYAPKTGSIMIDDICLDAVDLSTWRQTIGYVPQEMFLFHDTVFHNVTLGDPRIGRAAVEEALQSAGAWDFVSELPHGVETVLGERGATLSVGQRQRISIARALAREPRLLILDEVTASLDPAMEMAICDTLRGLRDQITVLAISHQPLLVELADIVYQLEGGRITNARAERPTAALA